MLGLRFKSVGAAALVLVSLMAACVPAQVPENPAIGAEKSPTEIRAPEQPSSSAQPQTPTMTIVATATALPCSQDWCTFTGHFLLQRPIHTPDERRIEQTYAFGATQGGKREVHHGVEFNNPLGTPVYAVGDGKVLYAGDDHTVEYGWWLDYYGNVILIEHSLPGYSMPIYSLYGHLSKLDVQTGDLVSAGDKIGEVGAEGKAIGAHLHFEIRMGGDTYNDVRNPMLWIKPLAGEGVLAGSVTRQDGKLFYSQGLTLKSASGKTWYPEIYGDPRLTSDADLNENFVVSDLPAGEYTITYSPFGVPYSKDITIFPGLVTKVNFTINQ